MPFKSKAQQKKFFAMEERGEIPKGTAKRWAEETPNIKKLPEKVKKKKEKKASCNDLVMYGFIAGLKKQSEYIIKTAGIDFSPGSMSAFGSQQTIDKINHILKTESIDSLVDKIKQDPKLTSEQKDKLIANIAEWQSKYKGRTNKTTQRFGEATGAAGGLLLSYLLMKGIGEKTIPGWLKILLGGIITTSSGIIGGLVGKNIHSRHVPIDKVTPVYSKWKGL